MNSQNSHHVILPGQFCHPWSTALAMARADKEGEKGFPLQQRVNHVGSFRLPNYDNLECSVMNLNLV